MKKLLISLALILFTCMMSSAQSKPCNDSTRIIVGIAERPSQAVYDGLFRARYRPTVRANQVVLVAAHACISTYYIVYDKAGQVVAAGRFVKRYAGDYDVVDLRGHFGSIRFSSTPLLAHN